MSRKDIPFYHWARSYGFSRETCLPRAGETSVLRKARWFPVPRYASVSPLSVEPLINCVAGNIYNLLWPQSDKPDRSGSDGLRR